MKLRDLCLLLVILLSAVIVSACATRSGERVAHSSDGVVATLRHEIENNVAVDRGFNHPIEVFETTLQALLSGILVRNKRIGVTPAIPGELVAKVSRGLAQALAEANSSEEIAITAIRRARHLGIFTEKFLTSFVAYVEGNQLVISFSRIDYDLAFMKNSQTKSERLPQPRVGEEVMNFAVIPRDGLQVVGKQIVRIALLGDGSAEKSATTAEPEPEAQTTKSVEEVESPSESSVPTQ